MIDKYFTTEQVAEILQVHPFTILKFIKNGKIKGIKLGRLYRINENDIKDFLEKLEVKAKEKREDKNKTKIVKEVKVDFEKIAKKKNDSFKVEEFKKDEIKKEIEIVPKQTLKKEKLEKSIEKEIKEKLIEPAKPEYIEENEEIYII